MKYPRVIALATVLAGSGAAAQTHVQIYGVIDAGVTQVSGLRQGTTTQLASGIMDGSRFGLRVNEDLGGGWRALVTLEHRLELDTGIGINRPISSGQLPDRISQAALLGLPAPLQPVVDAVATQIGTGVGVNLNNAFWDRQAFLGLVTPYGAILAGRQYTPAFEINARFDALGTQSGLSAGQVGSLPAAVDIRASNALAWRAEVGGLTLSVMHAAAEGSTTTGRLQGALAMYRSGALAVGVGYNTRHNEQGRKSLTNLVLGASMKTGATEFFAMTASIEDENPSGLSGLATQLTPQVGAPTAALVQGAFVNALKQDARLMHLGAKHTQGVHTLYLAWTQLDDKRAANADTQSYGVAYTYALSPRTDLNTVLVRFDNRGLGQAAPGGNGYLGGVTARAGTDATGLALGLRHRF
jgi:predicted porin